MKFDSFSYSASEPGILTGDFCIGIDLGTTNSAIALSEVDGRKLVYKVTAWDEKGPIGEGIHERAIIQNERFVSKAYSKLEQA